MGLLDQGIEVEMAVLRASEYTRGGCFPVAVRELGIRKLARISSIRRMFDWGRDLRKKGVTIVQVYFNDASVLAPWLLKLSGLNVVVCRRDMGYWRKGLTLVALRLMSPAVDRIIANARAVGDLACAQEWIARRKLVVIRNGMMSVPTAGADNSYEFPRPRNGRVGIVANIRAIKRIEDLIRAFAIVHERLPNIDLMVVGGGDCSALQRLAATYGVAGDVIFTGQVPDPISLIQTFDIGVICSTSEGLSSSLMEYSLCGKPVVATDCGGNREIVDDGRTGVIIPVGDYEALAEAIQTFLEDHEVARRMGQAGKQKMAEEFSVDGMLRSHLGLYKELEQARQRASRS